MVVQLVLVGLAARASRMQKAPRLRGFLMPLRRHYSNPSRTAKKALRRKGRLKASLAIAYTPAGGTKRTAKRAMTFKLARRR